MAGKGIMRWVYNHNPFYLISVCLVLYGIETTFVGSELLQQQSWYLTGILVGCTVLMAITACLIVRLGQVWDDARSIFMVLILLFFSLAVSFDELCITAPEVAVAMLGFGFFFSLLTALMVTRVLGIKIPAPFQFSFAAILFVAFAYPLLFSARMKWFPELEERWLIWAFPYVAAAALMTLARAIRRGKQAVENNGTPWLWPLFPWSAFVLLLVGLCGRGVLLCLSFEPAHGLNSIFGSYFLAPFVVVAAYLLLEIGVVEQNRFCRQFAMGFGLMAIPLSLPWHTNETYLSFLYTLTYSYGSPLWITCTMLLILFVMAWLRRLDRHASWLTIILLVHVFVAKDDFSFTPFPINAWPLIVLGIYHLAHGLSSKASWRFLNASAAFGLATMIMLAVSPWYELKRVAAAHVFLVGLLWAGSYCEDRMARQLNVVTASVIAGFAFGATVIALAGRIPPETAAVEIGFMGGLGLFCWKANQDRLFLFSSITCVAIGAVNSLALILARNGPGNREFAWVLFVAGVCFATGVFISALKAGLAIRLQSGLMKTRHEIAARFISRSDRDSRTENRV